MAVVFQLNHNTKLRFRVRRKISTAYSGFKNIGIAEVQQLAELFAHGSGNISQLCPTKVHSNGIGMLEERVHTAIKALDVVRTIITRNIEKGLLPNYTYRLIEIERQYNTIGIAAMYEAVREFGYIDTDEFGNKSYSDEGIALASEIMRTINTIKDSYDFQYSINIEAVPAERTPA